MAEDFPQGDEAPSQPERRSRSRRGAPRRARAARAGGGGGGQNPQILQRRLMAAGAVVLILILMVLGVRGCLDARKQRGLENYVSDVTALVGESNQLSESFFGRLEDPQQLTDLSFEAEVNSDRGTAEQQLERAHAIDTPDETAAAQADLILTFELRRDGLAVIANQLKTALGDEGRNRAVKSISRAMRNFLASDVMYERAVEKMQPVLEQEEISAELPQSQFLPDSPDYLEPTTVSSSLARVSGEDANVSGVHGLGLISTTVQPGDVVLTPGTEATITGGGNVELQVEVQNQGESTETDVPVSFTLSGGGSDITGEENISSIEAGETRTVTIPVNPSPPTGQALTLTVRAEPVPGEEVEDNNESEYQVRFS